jgi:hypothetical protein
MRLYVRVMMLLAGCTIPATNANTLGTDASRVEGDTAVKILLTKFDVNDTKLELGWKIKNDTDHDVWICASLKPGDPAVFDYFLDTDARTLVIRRRFNLPIEDGVSWEFPFYQARYVRLPSGEQRVESFSCAVPVVPRPVFGGLHANAECAERLVLEIGFYDEDLPGLILCIAQMAEMLGCDTSVFVDQNNAELADRFFGGWRIARSLELDATGFRESVVSNGSELRVPYMGLSLNGEKVLCIRVAGTSIPYRSSWPPLGN